MLSSAETFTVAGSASAAQTVVTKASSTNANDPQDGLSPFEANFYALTNLTLYDQYGNARFTNATGDADVRFGSTATSSTTTATALCQRRLSAQTT